MEAYTAGELVAVGDERRQPVAQVGQLSQQRLHLRVDDQREGGHDQTAWALSIPKGQRGLTGVRRTGLLRLLEGDGGGGTLTRTPINGYCAIMLRMDALEARMMIAAFGEASR